MRGEDGGNINAALLAKRDCNTCQPLVELDNDGALLLVEDVLRNKLAQGPAIFHAFFLPLPETMQ